MRGLSSLPLDDDIIDRILTFLPTFSALQAILVTSKSFSAVFNRYPVSTIRAIAYNVAGPALPQAMRLVRYKSDQAQLDGSDPNIGGPPETNDVSPITPEEAHILADHAKVAVDLEDLFSWRHKNRTSRATQLSSIESWRFRRAIYRIMLFSKVFPGDEVQYEEEEEEIEEARRTRKRFLDTFNTLELLELRSVSLFLREIAEWTTVAQCSYDHGSSYADYALAAGPALILESYKNSSTSPVYDFFEIDIDDFDSDMLVDYLENPLGKIWNHRGVKPPTEPSGIWGVLVDKVIGENDKCQRCSTIHGLALWNETNWDFLRGILSLDTIPTLFKGNLPQNHAERQGLTTVLGDPTFSYSTLLQEIFELKPAAIDSSRKNDWICQACVTEIIRSCLHLWWLEHKRKAGQSIPEDCWYGYNCRTQSRLKHATRVNHLCEPTRGS